MKPTFFFVPATIFLLTIATSHTYARPTFHVAHFYDEQGVACRTHARYLTFLLKGMQVQTRLQPHIDPIRITSLNDPNLFKCPILYMPYSNRPKMDFSPEEKTALKRYLDKGGFLFLDGGISPSFLENKGGHVSPFHNFPEWRVANNITTFFEALYPKKIFVPLTRKHPLFSARKGGLPSGDNIPKVIYEFQKNVKWKHGAIAALGLEINGRIGVLATGPIVKGQSPTSLRTREGNDALADSLRIAAHAGAPFTLIDEEGREETVYTQPRSWPAWVHQGDNKWRVFRYYSMPETNAFVTDFFEQVGQNIFIYIFTH